MASVLPYAGLDEVTDFVGLAKSLAAEFTGTLFLVRERKSCRFAIMEVSSNSTNVVIIFVVLICIHQQQ